MDTANPSAINRPHLQSSSSPTLAAQSRTVSISTLLPPGMVLHLLSLPLFITSSFFPSTPLLQSAHPPFFLLDHSSVHPSVCSSLRLTILATTPRFVCPSAHSSTCPFFRPSARLSVGLCVRPPSPKHGEAPVWRGKNNQSLSQRPNVGRGHLPPTTSACFNHRRRRHTYSFYLAIVVPSTEARSSLMIKSKML